MEAEVDREKVEACMKCPICNELLKEATTISLCLHTFCRKCIYEKLSDEEVDCCPVCDIDLGCLPLEKLRPDHTLQDIKEKMFPIKKRKIHLPETLPSVLPPPVKRKERSLSSLGFSTPKVSMSTGTTGRRTKAPPRRASGPRVPIFVFEGLNRKNDDLVEDIAAGSSSQDSLSKENKRQESSPEEPSKELKPRENKENGAEQNEGKNDMWKPLNCLVEAANRTKSSKLSSPFTSLEAPNGTKSFKVNHHVIALPRMEPPNMLRTKPKVEFPEPLGISLKIGSSSAPGPVKRRRARGPSQKKAAAPEDLNISAQPLLDASHGRCNRRSRPVWFSLVASEDLKGEASLPQISSGYLRIKDGNITVSIIQKYLMQKLHLNSESEVEIICRGRPILPNLQLHHLVDFWFATAPTTGRVNTAVGTSAKDFVMVLFYCRKALPP